MHHYRNLPDSIVRNNLSAGKGARSAPIERVSVLCGRALKKVPLIEHLFATRCVEIVHTWGLRSSLILPSWEQHIIHHCERGAAVYFVCKVCIIRG